MRVDDLQDDQVVRARWGRAGEVAPTWSPWQDARLNVQRHKGKVVCVTLKDHAWAEAGPSDRAGPDEWQENAYFVVEDYYLEIEGLTR